MFTFTSLWKGRSGPFLEVVFSREYQNLSIIFSVFLVHYRGLLQIIFDLNKSLEIT